jgi:hypothetical protein
LELKTSDVEPTNPIARTVLSHLPVLGLSLSRPKYVKIVLKYVSRDGTLPGIFQE